MIVVQAPAGEALTPLDRAPKGHWSNMNINDGDVEQDFLGGVASSQGVTRRFIWADLDTGTSSASYDFSSVTAALDLAAAGGYKLMIFPMWKTFNSVHPAPLWLRTSYEVSNAISGYSVKMHETVASDAFEAMMVSLASTINGHEALAGINIQESALGINPLTTGEQLQYFNNLKSIITTVCNAFSLYYCFWFVNHLTKPTVKTGWFYDAAIDVNDSINQANLVICSPDILPGSNSLSQCPSTTASSDNDRIYGVFRDLKKDRPDILMANSMQNESYDWTGGGGWPRPLDNTDATWWDLDECFHWTRECHGSEWVFWNYHSAAGLKYDAVGDGVGNGTTDAIAVFDTYTTWSRADNLIPADAEKDPTDAWWDGPTRLDGTTPFAEISTYDGEYSRRTGNASWAWKEDTTSGTHFLQKTFAATDFEPGQKYTVEWSVYPTGTSRDFRINLKLADGTFVGATLDVSEIGTAATYADAFWDESATGYRYREQYGGYYLIQVDHVIRPLVGDVGNPIIKFQLADASNPTSPGGYTFTGSGTVVCNGGRMQIFKTVRV